MNPKKSVLILVHGMGEQRQHESLSGTVAPIIQLMKSRGDDRDWAPDISGNTAYANQSDLEFENGGRTWRFAEYWWARGFNPAQSGRVALWIAVRLTSHLLAMRRSMARAGHDLKESFTDSEAPKDPRSARLYNFVAIPLYSFLVLLLWFLAPPLMLALIGLTYVKLVPGVPSVVAWAQKILSRIGIDFLGDIYVYLYDPVQAALIRGGLERMIEESVADGNVDSIVLFAHSTGNLLVYDALAHLRAEQTDLSKVRAFVGIGSILPMAWNNRIRRNDDDRFLRPMPDHIHWYHLWTRFDVGPAGPLSLPPQIRNSGPEVVNRRVNNHDDLLLDHTGYWNNVEQVYTLLLEEMGGLDQDNPFWRGSGLRHVGSERNWRSRSEQAWADFNMRRKAVSRLAGVRLGTLSAWPLMFSLMLWFNGWAKGIADFLQIDWIARSVRFLWLSGAIADPTLSPAAKLGLAALVSALLFGGLFILAYFGFKRVWWNRSFAAARRQRDDAFRAWRSASRGQQSA